MIFVVPRAQSLRFVNITNYMQGMYTHDSLLLQDENRISDEPFPYLQKFHTTDNIIVQIATDYTNVTLKVYDTTNAVQQTVTLSTVYTTTEGIKYLQGTISTSSLGGIYYAKIEATGVGLDSFIFQSEYFDVDDYDDYTLIKWRESDYAGLYYGDANTYFGFRIEADITPYYGETETESFEAFNSSVKNIKTVTKRKVEFRTDEIPRYIYEKLILAFGHNEVLVNGVEYVAVDSPSVDPVKDTQFYMFSRQLTQADYEVYDTFQTATGGDTPTPGTDSISWDGIDKVIVNNSSDILIPY